MSNRSQYKAMMEDVHAPAELLARVKGAPMEKKQIARGFALRYAAATCAALLGIFAVTNGVCYAATGETWVEKATVYINGQATEVDVHMSQNGTVTTAEMTYEISDGEGGAVEMTSIIEEEGGEGEGLSDYQMEITDYTTGTYVAHESDASDAMVVEGADGTVVLSIDGIDPIDITAQLKDNGAATGTYQKDGSTYVYEVSGTSGNYHIGVELQ